MLSSRSCASIAVISPWASRTSFGSGRSRSSDPRSKRRRRISFASSSIASSEGTTAAKRCAQPGVAVDDRLGLLVGQLRGALDDAVVELARRRRAPRRRARSRPTASAGPPPRRGCRCCSTARAAASAARRRGSRRRCREGRPPGRGHRPRARSARRRRCARRAASRRRPRLDPDRVVVVARRLRIDREGSASRGSRVREAVSSRPTGRATRAASASTSSGKAAGRSYFAITTLRSTPGSPRRPSTSVTRPIGLRVAVGGRVISTLTICPASAPPSSPAGMKTSCSMRRSKGTRWPPKRPSAS